MEPVFDGDDFQFSTEWDGNVVRIYHFEVNPSLEGNNIGSAILETLKRVYAYEKADKIEIRMGGGERAEAFLKKNGFTITGKEEFGPEARVRGNSIITAEYEYSDALSRSKDGN